MNPPIRVLGERKHSKASEKYVDVIFTYGDGSKWEGSVPIEYRRTGKNTIVLKPRRNYGLPQLMDVYLELVPTASGLPLEQGFFK